MSTTPEIDSDLEARLRVALTARAELVRPQDLAPPSTLVPLRPRRRATWVLLATAAVVVLVLGVVLQGTGGRPRSDDLAPQPQPQPDGPQVVLPDDVGREWNADDLATPARLDLDGDDTMEKVVFLSEPSDDFDGRIRLQTTVSSTGEEAYGIAELGTTIGTNALEPIDADGDGDQELVLWYDDVGANGPGGGGYPLVFDLRDGLLVQAAVEEADLLVRGHLPVPGDRTEFYEMVRLHDYWVEDGRLFSSRSVNAFASGNMTLMRPETIVVDTWEWSLGGDGVLRRSETRCRVQGPELMAPCQPGAIDDLPSVASAAGTIGVGQETEFREGYRFTAGIEAMADASVVVRGSDGRVLTYGLEVADPRVATVQPMSVFSDGASVLVTSASDPSYVQVLVQDGDRLRALEPVGEIDPVNDGDVRTWLTENGALVTVVADADGTWRSWSWMLVSPTEMAALPSGTVCFDDVDDPSTARAC